MDSSSEERRPFERSRSRMAKHPKWMLALLLIFICSVVAMVSLLTLISNQLSKRQKQSRVESAGMIEQPTNVETFSPPVTATSSLHSDSPSSFPSLFAASDYPSDISSDSPSSLPSMKPFENNGLNTPPIYKPSLAPSTLASSFPSLQSSLPPTLFPSLQPTRKPKSSPSRTPLLSPTSTSPSSSNATFTPGHLIVQDNDLLLSQGLKSRLLAVSGRPVAYSRTTDISDLPFHVQPDFGACFPDLRPNNEGGWIYVSNSEARNFTVHPQRGGVGAITFDSEGSVVNYRMLLTGTEANCGGGKTPWGSWISCEEYSDGNLWQVDPTGEREAKRITLGNDGGLFESFAFDIRNNHYFVTEDKETGPLRRFTPAQNDWSDPWNILYGPGITEYLLLEAESTLHGRYSWTTNKQLASKNAGRFFRNSEGIDIHGSELVFISKAFHSMITLDLDGDSYTNSTTKHGAFDGQPDQVTSIIGSGNRKDLLFFTEEGGRNPGIHARNSQGQFFTILESPIYTKDETTGLAFSPDKKHLYFAFQDTGLLFDITRNDGLAFGGKVVDVKYHNTANSG